MPYKAEFEAVMNRIRNLDEDEVEVTIPEDFQFEGPVPFDISIAGDKAWVKILAVSMEEAKFKAYEYFEGKYK